MPGIIRWVARLIPLALLPVLSATLVAALESRHVEVITVKGVIDPVTSNFVSRGIAAAEKGGAECLIVEMDTPGGLDTSMRAIVQRILSSEVPVVLYVAPTGARAASAGVFIAAAANIVAMAPGTNLGAAHPVNMGGELPPTVAEKAANDAAAYVRSLAELRGRNAGWLENAVYKSVSASAQEAVELGVADFVATDLADLLAKLDGRSVKTATKTAILQTRDVAVRREEMNLFEKLLHVIVDPTIAYLLLTIGGYAILVELYNPGSTLPAVIGVVCFILFLVAMESLPLNWGGLALLGVSAVLFVVDIKAPTHGALTAGGIAIFVLGSLLLFTPLAPVGPTMPEFRANYWVVGSVGALTAAFFIAIVTAGMRAQRLKPAILLPRDEWHLMGARGRAKSDLNPKGTVLLASEEWTAIAEEEEEIKAGDTVEVMSVEGLRLKVRKARALASTDEATDKRIGREEERTGSENDRQDHALVERPRFC